MSDVLFRCFIPGRPRVKKNSKRIVTRGGRRFPISSQSYMSWEARARAHVIKAMVEQGINEPISTPIQLKATFHFTDRRSEADLSNLYEGVQDLLQKLGAIKDDKLIQSHDGSRKVFGEGDGMLVEVRAFFTVRKDNE